MNTYVFGDIEGMDNAYESTNRCIEETSTDSSQNCRYIFLGDIYTADNIDKSIDMVEHYTRKFFQFDSVINDNSSIVEIIRLFRKIWKQKNLKTYNKSHIQYWKSAPKADADTYLYDFKAKFLFGNKEIEFLYDMITSKNITKDLIDSNYYLTIPVSYFNPQTQKHISTIRKYSMKQLNVMYNYLTHCCNYYLENSILFTHCFSNYKKMEGTNIINSVVAGHNKCYGKFVDYKSPSIDIYIVDITYSDNKELNNYMSFTSEYKMNLFNETKLDDKHVLGKRKCRYVLDSIDNKKGCKHRNVQLGDSNGNNDNSGNNSDYSDDGNNLIINDKT